MGSANFSGCEKDIMKIAFLSLFNDKVDRGAETFVKEVASRLSVDNEVTVFQVGLQKSDLGYSVNRVKLNADFNKEPQHMSLTKRFFLDYWSIRTLVFTLKLLPELWRKKFDVVIPTNGGWQSALCRLLTWGYGGKLLISGQSGKGWDDLNNLWSFPDLFVALSRNTKRWVSRANPFVKSVVIPNGVDLKKFTPKGEKLETSLKQPIVICVGALTPGKRIDLAIKAVAKTKASLLVVGSGSEKKKLGRLAGRYLKGRCEIVSLPFEEMPKAYRVAHAFTLPSAAYHSFEIVLVEAMAANLPVVANNDPIRREIVGRAGTVVDPQDTNAYAQAIEEVLLRSWKTIPRRESQRFNWDNIASEYERHMRLII